MEAPLPELTLTKLLERSHNLFASRPAVGFAGEAMMTYGEWHRKVRHLSQVLLDHGIGFGDRVALLGENGPHWGIVYFSVTTIGAVVVPILPDFHPSEISHILRHSESRVLFVSERLQYKIEDLHLELLEAIFLLDDLSVTIRRISKETQRRHAGDERRTIGKGKKTGEHEPEAAGFRVAPEDPAAIVYTSGTTGHCKGVMLAHRNIVSNAIACAKIQDIAPEDRLLSILPLPHVFECTVGLVLPVMQGCSIHYLRRPPTAAVMLPALETVRPTMMLAVPLIIEKILKTQILPGIRRHQVSRLLYRFPAFRRQLHRLIGLKLKRLFGGELRFFGIGGAPLAPEVEQLLLEAGFPFAIGYGLTETSPLVAGCPPKRTRLQSTGPPVPGAEIRIADPDVRTRIGEIQVRGDPVMLGYYKDPERTAAAFTPDGWFKTGDLGRFDDDGYLYVTGRLKDMILGPSGENIYPEAIESVIARSEIVHESLVYQDEGSLVARVHLDYEKLDEQFAAEGLTESQVRSRIEGLLEEIKRTTNQHVSAFSCLSRVIEQVEPFEKTPTQKIKRHLYTARRGEF